MLLHGDPVWCDCPDRMRTAPLHPNKLREAATPAKAMFHVKVMLCHVVGNYYRANV